jgi:hypothetical protein
MADDDIKALTDIIDKLFRLMVIQQVNLLALESYVREQPSFDRDRYVEIFRAQQALVDRRLQGLTGASPDVLLAFFQDYKGPIQ